MQCVKCKVFRREEDFFFKNTKCYKCVLEEKVSKMPAKKRICRICRCEIPKGRWIFCGKKCAMKDYDSKNISWAKRLKMEADKHGQLCFGAPIPLRFGNETPSSGGH